MSTEVAYPIAYHLPLNAQKYGVVYQIRKQIFGKSPSWQYSETKKSIEMLRRLDEVVDLIRKDPTISQREIAAQLGITLKQAKIATDLLKQDNRIHREGSPRRGRWIID